MPGWSDAPEDPVGQIDGRGPEIWKWPGVWSLEPGARCQLLAGYRWGVGNYWAGSSPGLQRACVCVCVSASERVSVTVTTTVLGCFPSFGGAGCTGQVQLAITRRMLEDGIGVSIQPWIVGGWSMWAPRSMAATKVTTGRARQREGGLMWVGCWMLTGAGSWERGEELGAAGAAGEHQQRELLLAWRPEQEGGEAGTGFQLLTSKLWVSL